MKTTVISVLGPQADDRGDGPDRWDALRPNVGLTQQDDFAIDELHLVFNTEHRKLAEQIREDIGAVSPETTVILDVIDIRDSWDFEEVYAKFYDYAQDPRFHEETTQCYVHMTTGSHVEQICLFLLTESRHFPAKLIQTLPKEGAVPRSFDPRGMIGITDLDLSRYDQLARRFETRRRDDLSFLKQGIATKNAAFNRLIETIERVAVRSADPILLTGPTGAGKSQLAKQIYLLRKKSGKTKGKFVAVNCATLDGDLAKSALFGHVKGAFSGAEKDHAGFLKEADGGILFLDEIGELPLEAQAMLLKAIEEKTYRPLGATADERSDFQLVCGTNRALGKPFRADLLARINLWNFRLPGLAERREDIEPNLDYELEHVGNRLGRHLTLNKEARQKFLAYALAPTTTWPGNFRDLNAMVVRMATLADSGRITAELVAEEIVRAGEATSQSLLMESRTSFRSDLDVASPIDLANLLGADYAERYDAFDLLQLAPVINICRRSASAAEAARQLYAVSFKAKTSSNNTDRLSKYLARFGLKFKEL